MNRYCAVTIRTNHFHNTNIKGMNAGNQMSLQVLTRGEDLHTVVTPPAVAYAVRHLLQKKWFPRAAMPNFDGTWTPSDSKGWNLPNPPFWRIVDASGMFHYWNEGPQSTSLR